ncbi:YjfB family protein [Acetivibrio ethanolgignens]|uniref:YjfB family protein n=1 Tax=Acetivibrio ethanolgignens TaxID=290052 RepID=UPI0009FB3937|nr:YjfB family protein [Acetivibrio ethanolgignens]
MDIPAMATAMSQAQLMTQVNVAILANSLSSIETMGNNMVKMMEQSVCPNLGGNIDITV